MMSDMVESAIFKHRFYMICLYFVECLLPYVMKDVGYGRIRQPYFSRGVPQTPTCTYQLSTPDVSSKLALSFPEFKLDKAHMTIFDGDFENSTQLAHFSGTTLLSL